MVRSQMAGGAFGKDVVVADVSRAHDVCAEVQAAVYCKSVAGRLERALEAARLSQCVPRGARSYHANYRVRAKDRDANERFVGYGHLEGTIRWSRQVVTGEWWVRRDSNPGPLD